MAQNIKRYAYWHFRDFVKERELLGQILEASW